MTITLNVQLTDEQHTLLTDVAHDVLGDDATDTAITAWATNIAAGGLKDELLRLSIEQIDSEARVAVNLARQDAITAVESAWPDPEPEADEAAVPDDLVQ